jgi:hypothetical protein
MTSIIIVTYNNQSEIADCLDSIDTNIEGKDYEVIVVDNDSKDKTARIIRDNYPWVRLFNTGKNLGFGRGNNYGAKKARGEYLFFLNPDTIVVNDIVNIIEKFFPKNPEAGAVGIRQLYRNGDNRPENISEDPNIANLVRNIFPRKYNWHKKQEVQVICAAALAVKKDVFEKIGGFDPEFFMYMEENDLCLRIRQAGYKIFYHPEGKIVHLAGRSTKDVRDIKKMYYQSQDLFYRKHYSKPAYYLMKVLRWPKKIIKITFK